MHALVLIVCLLWCCGGCGFQRLTGGVDGGVHVTDVTNASRTMLMNIKTLKWDSYLCRSVLGRIARSEVRLLSQRSNSWVRGQIARSKVRSEIRAQHQLHLAYGIVQVLWHPGVHPTGYQKLGGTLWIHCKPRLNVSADVTDVLLPPSIYRQRGR